MDELHTLTSFNQLELNVPVNVWTWQLCGYDKGNCSISLWGLHS